MEGKNVGVEMAAEAARETGANAPENPEQRLVKAFEAAVEQLLGKKVTWGFQHEVQGKWIVLSVYFSGSQKRRFFKKPEVVRRGILASYLNTPFKVKELPTGLAGHWFRVVALLQPNADNAPRG